MKTTRLLALTPLLGAVLAGADLLAQNDDSPLHADSAYYAFLSGELQTELKNAVHGVRGSDGKKLLLEGSSKRVPFSSNTLLSFTPAVALSDTFAEVTDVDLGFSSIATTRREAQMASNSMAIEAQAELETAVLTHELSKTDTTDKDGRLHAEELKSTIEQIRVDTQDTLEAHESFEDEGFLGFDNIYDIYYAKFSVTPTRDIENAYAVLVLSFDETDELLKRQEIRRSIVRVAPVGFLQAGVPNPVKISRTFTEQKVEGEELDVYLFASDGTPVATNRSRALKELTAEQLATWQRLEAKQGEL